MIYIGEKVDKSVWMRVFAAPPSNSSSKLIPFNWPSKITPPSPPLPCLFLDFTLSDIWSNPLKIKSAVSKDCTYTHK